MELVGVRRHGKGPWTSWNPSNKTLLFKAIIIKSYFDVFSKLAEPVTLVT
jgi:hypothetical protein